MRHVGTIGLTAGVGASVERALRAELERSRRYEHPLALVWLPLADGRAIERHAETLREAVREVDCVVAANGGVLVLLPECDAPMAHALLARLVGERPSLLPLDTRAVAFPADGVTAGSLLERLVSGEYTGLPVPQPPEPAPDPRALRSFARRVLVRVRGAGQPDGDVGSQRVT